MRRTIAHAVLLLILGSSAVVAQSSSESPTSPQQGAGRATNSPDAVSTVAPAPTVPDSTGLEIIMNRKADYPIAAARDGIQGQVWVKLHIAETGDVVSVEVISGDPILAESAVKAAKKFKFKPFIQNGKPVKVATRMPFDFFFSEKLMNKGVSADNTTTSGVSAGTPPRVSPVPPTSPTPSSSDADTPKRVRLSQGVSQGLLIRQIAPIYPLPAKRNHVQGSVVLRAVIQKDGRIGDLKAISGPQELIPAAVGAVQQWRYKPYILMGEPVEVDTQITVNFQLSF